MSIITEIANSNTTSLFKGDVKTDQRSQDLVKQTSTLLQDQEGKAKSLAERTTWWKPQEADNKDIGNLEAIEETQVASSPLVIDPVDDEKSACFKKYPEYFSGIDKTRSAEEAKEFYTLNESNFRFTSSCS